MRHLRRLSGLVVLSALAACSSAPPPYDLRAAYLAAVPGAQGQYLDCDGVSDIVCDCRRGGIEAEFQKPSLTDFDAGYAVLVAEREAGTPFVEAEHKAVQTVFAEVTKDVEDICSYHEQGNLSD